MADGLRSTSMPRAKSAVIDSSHPASSLNPRVLLPLAVAGLICSFLAGADIGYRLGAATSSSQSGVVYAQEKVAHDLSLPARGGTSSSYGSDVVGVGANCTDSGSGKTGQSLRASPCSSALQSALPDATAPTPAPQLTPSSCPICACPAGQDGQPVPDPSASALALASPSPAGIPPTAATAICSTGPCESSEEERQRRWKREAAMRAACPADGLREVGSLHWGSQHWCPEMDTGGSWAPLNATFVPLVPYGLDTRNDSAHGPRIYYGPEGLLFENNGQGGQGIVREQESSMLKWQWLPAGCSLRNLTRPQVQELLRDQWIHLDGDSLVRDHFYDILETLEMGGFGREKKHENLPAHVLGLNVDVTFGWSPPGNPPCPERPVWSSMKPQGREHDLGPHVWIYSSGLWDIPLNTSDAEYLQRLNCTLHAKPPGTLGIYRLNSMYAAVNDPAPSLFVSNGRLETLNRWTVEAIRRYNCGRDGYLERWHIADFAPAMYQRPELARYDRVHYTGVGSRTFTLMLLNVVAEAAERLGEWTAPSPSDAPRRRG